MKRTKTNTLLYSAMVLGMLGMSAGSATVVLTAAAPVTVRAASTETAGTPPTSAYDTSNDGGVDIWKFGANFAENADTPQATEAVPINETTFPDDAVRQLVQEMAKSMASEPDIVSDEELDDWDGESLLPSMLNYPTSLDLSIPSNHASISDLHGLEVFPNLQQLGLEHTGVKDLTPLNDVPALKEITMNFTPATDLATLTNPSIQRIALYDTSSVTGEYESGVDSIDFSHLPGLKMVQMDGSTLSSIKFAPDQKLQFFSTRDTPNLTNVDLGDMSELLEFDVKQSPKFFKDNSLDLTTMPNLMRVQANEDGLTNVNYGQSDKLRELQMYSNNLTKLDLSGFPNLTNLFVDGNDLKTLDLSNNPYLVYLSASSDNLSKLDLTGLHELQTLHAGANQISDITFDTPKISQIQLGSNKLSGELDLSNYPELRNLTITDNQLTSLKLNNDPH
ncbi:leucine-rich repeat domain-containing protein [Lacticaseibacillus mingshuiensis]|uniref:Leucine-rich repeat domain-containing protein n=1 Tax=Lacticaseibacillus mingshuiensis TaxID=2799574 RepID=A0ABW4CFS7_9LACO|nr:hypothetical protein [Lacticaseibacillus mingshuiensis]